MEGEREKNTDGGRTKKKERIEQVVRKIFHHKYKTMNKFYNSAHSTGSDDAR